MAAALRLMLLALVAGFAGAGTAWATQADSAAQRLEAAIADLRLIERWGGYTPVPDHQVLRPGMRSLSVPLLANRLRESGDLSMADDGPDVALYDEALARAVRRFQRRHGLADDAIVGWRTFAALNRPVGELIARATINLARLLDEPRPGPGRHIIINLPDYTLTAYRDGVPVLTIPVVIGRPEQPTPLMSSAITALVVNPEWRIPYDVVRGPLAQVALADPEWPARAGIVPVGPGWPSPGDGEPVDWSRIDWAAVASGDQPIGLRQAPGPANPHGRFRFHMRNRHAIHLHDTNQKQLFRKARRASGWGSIPVGDAEALASFVAAGADARWWTWSNDPDWEERWIRLRGRVPVDIIYRTVWVDEDGVLQVRDDIYQRDGAPAPRLLDVAEAAK